MKWRVLRIGIPVLSLAVILAIYFVPEFAAFVFQTLAFLTPLWLPVGLYYVTYPVWFYFARLQYTQSIPYITLELRPGVETPRTAKPMELVLYSLYHRTDITKREFLLGHVRMPWSFEIYAHAGAVRFFVHVPENHREALEARIKSEYYDIDIFEVRDYTREFDSHSRAMKAVSYEYTLTKPDPYPIKTFTKYEAEPVRRDVCAEMLRSIADIGRDEHVFISYIIRPHQRERVDYFKEPIDTLHQDAYHVIAGIVGASGDPHALSPGKQAVVAAIESALQKPSFDCGIRALYVAENNSFNQGLDAKLANLFDTFSDSDLNGFTAYDPMERMGFIQKEFAALSTHYRSKALIDLFRTRSFFAPPYSGEAFILNTEELATVFHMPPAGRGSVLAHHASANLVAPQNLPV